MKLLLKNFTLFTLILLITFVIGEFLSRQIFHSRSDLFLKWKDFQSREPIRALALGSSHMEKAFAPVFFSPHSHNLAYSSQDLYNDLQIFIKVLQSHSRLEWVLIDISPFTWGYEEVAQAKHLIKDYWWDLDIDPETGLDPQIIFRLSTLYTHRNQFVRGLTRGHSPKPYRSFPPKVVPWEGPRAEYLLNNGQRHCVGQLPLKELNLHAQKTARRHSTHFNVSAVETRIHLVQSLIQMAYKQQVHVALIVPPVTPAYLENLDPQILQRAKKILTDLKAQLPENSFFYIDAHSELAPTLDSHHFHDSDHLNAEGAQVFTGFIKKTLNL